jgi:hypothetical protein
MRDVYATAKKVVAWLGNAIPTSEEAIDFLYTLYIAISKLVQGKEAINQHALTQMAGCKYPSDHWTALSIFLENPWFQRTWIVQEVVFAKQIDLICGEKKIQWFWVASVLGMIINNGLLRLLTRHIEGELSIPPKGIHATVNALAIRILHQASQPPSISWLLVDCWRLDATDGRDKVFALLGMASDAQDSDFEPNYGDTTTTERVFHRSTVRLLTRDRLSNRVLHAAGVGYP